LSQHTLFNDLLFLNESGESMIQLPIHKLVLNSEPLTSILLLLFFLYHSMAKILRVSNSTSVDSSCFHE